MDGKLEKNGEASVLRFHELGRLVLGLRRVDAGCWKFRAAKCQTRQVNVETEESASSMWSRSEKDERADFFCL